MLIKLDLELPKNEATDKPIPVTVVFRDSDGREVGRSKKCTLSANGLESETPAPDGVVQCDITPFEVIAKSGGGFYNVAISKGK